MINYINNFDTINNFNKIDNNIQNINNKVRIKNNDFKTMLEDTKNDVINNQGRINKDKLNKSQKKLLETCNDLESIFWKQLLNEMKKTINKYKLLDGGQAEDIFTDMLYDEYSKIMVKNSNTGISTDIFKQLYKNI